MPISFNIDRNVQTEVHVQKTLELTREEVLAALDPSEFADVLETAIGPLLDDLYTAVKEGKPAYIDHYFDSLYETIDRQKPVVLEDAA